MSKPKGKSTEPQQPLQIPPTRARRRKRTWPRGARPVFVVVVVAILGAGATTFVNREVSRRLATMPVVTTSSSQPTTTTTVVPSPETPRHQHNDPVAVTIQAPTTSTTAPAPEVPQSAYDIITKLDTLPVRDERSLGYARYRFGLWADEDGDGCTVRDDVMVSQAVQAVRRTDPCRVVSGRWLSVYDNAEIENPDDIRIDHVVALVEAWESGAYRWSDARRNTYLNDISDATAILAVSRISEEDKDSRDPADWVPTNISYRCRYLQTWVDVKSRWKLSVDPGERESIAAAALNC